MVKPLFLLSSLEFGNFDLRCLEYFRVKETVFRSFMAMFVQLFFECGLSSYKQKRIFRFLKVLYILKLMNS